MDLYAREGQKRRRDEIITKTLEHYGYLLTDDKRLSEWVKQSGIRDALFFSAGLLSMDQPDIVFIEKLWFSYPEEHWQRFCAFTPFMAMVQLIMYEDKLTERMKDRLKDRAINAMKEVCMPPLDFVGVNDNHPAMNMALLFLAGEYFDQPEWIQVALPRLEQLEQMISDRTFISEYNSPTYHPVTLYALAALVECVKDESIRARALACEEALWKMALVLYHRSSCQNAGPYARAYMVDSTIHTHQYRMVYYQIMGDAMELNPVNTLYAEDRADMVIHGNVWFMMLSNCWLAHLDYHCPKQLIDEALHREYPVWIRGNAQVSASADTHMIKADGEALMYALDMSKLYDQDDLHEYPAGVTEIFSYITDQYALGTCTKEFHNGAQADSFHAIISEGSPKAQNQRGLASIYTRYVINDQTNETHLISDFGRKLAFQWENTAIVLYSPKTYIQEVESMKLCILINNGFGTVKEILCGGETLTEGSEIKAGEPIFIRFGKVYCAVYPLLAGTEAKLRVERIQGALSLSIVNYEGAAVHYSRKRLKLTPAGFAFEIRTAAEAGDFKSFMLEMSGAKVSDTLYANLHTRFAVERKVRYERGSVKLECSYSPVSEGIRYIRANDKILV